MLTRTLALGCVVVLGIAGLSQGQVTQQSTPAAGAKLELSSASSAAKSEFWLGLDDWQNFSYSSAQKHFERSSSLDPSLGLARAFAAAAPAIRGETVPVAELDRGIVDAARASTTEGLLALAWREKAATRNSSATSLFRAAMDLMPNEPRIASEYIWSLASSDMKAALEAGKAARARFPTSGPISPALSFVFLQSGDTTAAMAEAERYTQLAPTQPASFVFYGDMLRLKGRYDEAEAQYRRSLTLSPRHADGGSDGVVALASLLQQRGKSAEVHQLLTDAVKRAVSAEDSTNYFQLAGGASLYAGDVPAALSAFEVAARVAAKARSGLGAQFPMAQLALTNAAFGDRKSVSKYVASIHLNTPGDSTQMEIWLADIYAYAGEADSAFKYADRLAARASSNTAAGLASHFVRGQLYLTTRRCENAIPEFRQSDSSIVEVQAGNAECEMQLGHREAALRWRDRALAHRDVNLYDPGEIHAYVRMRQMR